MATRRAAGVTKRRADVPVAARIIANMISKADVLEVAWDMAGLCNDAESADDDASSLRAFVFYLNRARKARGASTIDLKKIAAKYAKCAACKGTGKLGTWSKNTGTTEHACPSCKGTGRHAFDVSLLEAAAAKEHGEDG